MSGDDGRQGRDDVGGRAPVATPRHRPAPRGGCSSSTCDPAGRYDPVANGCLSGRGPALGTVEGRDDGEHHRRHFRQYGPSGGAARRGPCRRDRLGRRRARSGTARDRSRGDRLRPHGSTNLARAEIAWPAPHAFPHMASKATSIAITRCCRLRSSLLDPASR